MYIYLVVQSILISPYNQRLILSFELIVPQLKEKYPSVRYDDDEYGDDDDEDDDDDDDDDVWCMMYDVWCG